MIYIFCVLSIVVRVLYEHAGMEGRPAYSRQSGRARNIVVERVEGAREHVLLTSGIVRSMAKTRQEISFLTY